MPLEKAYTTFYKIYLHKSIGYLDADLATPFSEICVYTTS
jgi:hypothetical protein